MRSIQLDKLLNEIEACGGAIDPAHAMAMVAACRRLSGVAADLAKLVVLVVDGMRPPATFIDSLSDRMEQARTVVLPEVPS